MNTIKEDIHGLYIISGGWIARPCQDDTQFTSGDLVKTHHFGGSALHGVGKDTACRKGQYLETWKGVMLKSDMGR